MFLSGTDTAAGSDDPGALSQEGIGIASVYRVGGELREEGEGKGGEARASSFSSSGDTSSFKSFTHFLTPLNLSFLLCETAELEGLSFH